jgi:hypothetical protein
VTAEPVTGEPYRRNAYRRTFGNCPLCGAFSWRLVVDHCHRHGLIRGRVCESCNQSLRHAEQRHTVAELLEGVCSHRHRSNQVRARCRAAYRKANARLLEHWCRCPECAAT